MKAIVIYVLSNMTAVELTPAIAGFAVAGSFIPGVAFATSW